MKKLIVGSLFGFFVFVPCCVIAQVSTTNVYDHATYESKPKGALATNSSQNAGQGFGDSHAVQQNNESLTQVTIDDIAGQSDPTIGIIFDKVVGIWRRIRP